METEIQSTPGEAREASAIIVGFGLPGRFVAEVLDARKIPYTVIEMNPASAKSIADAHKRVVCGDARQTEVLRAAGIERATFLAIALPDEKVALEVLQAARPLNGQCKIMARVHYTSTGIRAEKGGAEVVVVSEQIVAVEFARLVGELL